MESTQSPRAAGGTLPPAEQAQPQLPPGFRFHPTDEELVVHYLKRKAQSAPLPVSIIAEIDLYKFDPWELPEKAVFGEQEWYFFSPRERKYPNGARPNRAATSGYWKATGTDKPVLSSGGNQKVGVKKALVFYGGKPPRGVKTNWIMHEYRLVDHNKPINKPPPYDHSNKNKASLKLDDWVLCRIYKKNNTNKAMDQERDESMDDAMMMGPMSSMSIPSCSINNNIMGHHSSFSKANYNSFLNTHVDQQQQGLFDGMMVGHGMDSGAPPSLSHLSNPSSFSSLKRTFPPQYWGGTDPDPNTGVSVGVGSGGDGCDLPSPSKRMSLLHMSNDSNNTNNNNNNNNNSSEESGSRSCEQQETNNNNMNSFSSLLNQQPLHQQAMLGGLNDGVFRHPYSLPELNWYS